HKGAQILNFSSGWKDTNNPDYAAWRIAIENVSDHMLFVTGAGNNGNLGNVPFSVETPGRVPMALAVGGSKQNNTIDSGSCNGPITWTNVMGYSDYPHPPGLNKPDLAAPGVDIITLQLGGGHTPLRGVQGTSFETAHVSGAAALLLAKNPLFSPYAVRFILEKTAAIINGTDQPNPGAGWG